jgi:hypothetical protein
MLGCLVPDSALFAGYLRHFKRKIHPESAQKGLIIFWYFDIGHINSECRKKATIKEFFAGGFYGDAVGRAAQRGDAAFATVQGQCPAHAG